MAKTRIPQPRTMLSASIEDYIKAIYALEAEEHQATTKRIAERLGVRMASVTGMLKHLSAEGYVKHTPRRGARLTELGHRVAVGMIRRHRLLELFLSRTLGLPWDELHDDAERLEHGVSDHLIERMYEFLGCPEFDPHGSPIPARDGSIAPRRGVPLSDLNVGERGAIVEVADRDPAFLRYLTALNLGIGTEVMVREKAPYAGPIVLGAGSARVAISPEAASRVRVARANVTHRRGRARTARLT